MDKFEEMRRKLDDELSRLKKFVEDDLAPETEKRTAQFLREVSEKLTEAAWLAGSASCGENRIARKGSHRVSLG